MLVTDDRRNSHGLSFELLPKSHVGDINRRQFVTNKFLLTRKQNNENNLNQGLL